MNDVKKHVKAALIVALLGRQAIPLRAIAASEDLSPVTLAQCNEWAQAQSESLKSRREAVEQSRARARAALGGALPRLDWEWRDTWQDPDGVKELERKGFSGFVEKNQVESKFTLEQPLFSGLREFSAWSGFRRESARDALRLERASRELFETVAAAFYAVLTHESDRDNAAAALALAEDRVKDLREFRRLGKARASEVFTAQAHAAALRARLQQIRSRIIAAREDLSFLTGRDLSSRTLRDDIPGPPPVEALDDVLARAAGRSDLRAQREEVAAQQKRVRYQKGLYWPAVDLSGNYYTQRATFLEVLDWDLMLSLKVPLFRGGATAAGVREAESAYRQSLLALEEMERNVLHGMRKLHADLTAVVEEAKAQEEAAQAAQKSYDALREEYGLGLVANLDVLQALDLLQAQRRAWDAARLQAKIAFLRLQVAMEKMP